MATSLQVGITTELERIAGCVGARVDGVIGYNFLRNLRLTIDYERWTVLLQRDGRGAMRAQQDISEVLFRLAHPTKPLIIVPVQGHHRLPGSPFTPSLIFVVTLFGRPPDSVDGVATDLSPRSNGYLSEMTLRMNSFK